MNYQLFNQHNSSSDFHPFQTEKEYEMQIESENISDLDNFEFDLSKISPAKRAQVSSHKKLAEIRDCQTLKNVLDDWI